MPWSPSERSAVFILTYYLSFRRHFLSGICSILGYYAALSGSSVPTFRDKISVPSSTVKISKPPGCFSWTCWRLKMEPIGYPETSVQNYHSMLCNMPEERRSHLHHGGSLTSRILFVSSGRWCDE
jgi:hypothetical protein